MTSYIFLKPGKYAIIDDDDVEKTKICKWFLNGRGYAQNSKGQTMHRLISNPPDGMECDHINGNRLDNRRVNLRICTRDENSLNRQKYKNNKTGYKGVNFQNGKFHASIYHKKKYHLGAYKNAEDAARVYDQKAREFFGVFATLNFPEEL